MLENTLHAARRGRSYLPFALIIGIICFLAFAVLTLQVQWESPILLLDRALAHELHRTITPFRAGFFKIITLFGYQLVYLLAALVAVSFFWRRQWLDLTMGAVTVVGGLLLNGILKALIARPRPFFTDPVMIEVFYSFPSGHAMTALIAYGFGAYLLWRVVKPSWLRALVIFGAALMIVLVGISRLYLGVHYLSDVVGGFLAGGVWLALCIVVIEVRRGVS